MLFFEENNVRYVLHNYQWTKCRFSRIVKKSVVQVIRADFDETLFSCHIATELNKISCAQDVCRSASSTCFLSGTDFLLKTMKFKKTVTCCISGHSFCLKYTTKIMRKVNFIPFFIGIQSNTR